MLTFACVYFNGHLSYWDHIAWAMLGLGIAVTYFMFAFLGSNRLNLTKAEIVLRKKNEDSQTLENIADIINVKNKVYFANTIVFITYTALVITLIGLVWSKLNLPVLLPSALLPVCALTLPVLVLFFLLHVLLVLHFF